MRTQTVARRWTSDDDGARGIGLHGQRTIDLREAVSAKALRIRSRRQYTDQNANRLHYTLSVDCPAEGSVVAAIKTHSKHSTDGCLQYPGSFNPFILARKPIMIMRIPILSSLMVVFMVQARAVPAPDQAKLVEDEWEGASKTPARGRGIRLHRGP